MSDSNRAKPSVKASRRLLEFCAEHPEWLPSLLKLLPQDHDTAVQINALCEKHGAELGEKWREKVRKHLQFHSDFFRDDLYSDARAARDANDDGGYVEHSDELERLSVVDWPRAQPLLQQLASGKWPRTALLAQTLTYRHYMTTKDEGPAAVLRSQLKDVVADQKALGYCRNQAAEALLTTEWAGRDEWYLSLFHDPTLRDLPDGYAIHRPLTGPVYDDPDRWIPVMAQLVGNADPAVHNAAVSCLIGFHLDSGRSDALKPLLPWLMDPKWSSASDRLRLIQTVDRLEMTESVPGLIAVLTEVGDPADRSYAAESLAHFRDPRAIPALRIALFREKEADHRRRIIKALVACGGIAPAEAAHAVEAFAKFTLTPEGREKWVAAEDSYGRIEVPVDISLGAYIARNGPEDDDAVELLVRRVEELRSARADLARRLQSLTANWASQAADRAVVRYIRDGSITAEVLGAALQRRDSLQKTVSGDLHELESALGLASGLAAVLLSDKQKQLAILKGGDVDATIALLAGARLVREKLPIEEVSRCQESGDPLLNSSLDAYLEAEDSPAARKLYMSRHRGEAKILGARQSFDPGHHSFRDFNHLEEQLQQEIKAGEEDDEIYALLSGGYWGNAGQITVRANARGAEIKFVDDPARYYTRQLTGDEWRAFQQFLRENQVDDLGPLNLAVWDGMQYEYIHLGREGGRRVFMNNPGLGGSGGTAYDRLCHIFREMANAVRLEPHYKKQ